MGVLQGLQLMLDQDGGVKEAFRRAKVNEGFNRDGRLARDQKMDQESKVTGEKWGKGGGGNRTTQPGSYWLGRSFFGTEEVGVLGWGGITAQGPGKGP